MRSLLPTLLHRGFTRGVLPFIATSRCLYPTMCTLSSQKLKYTMPTPASQLLGWRNTRNYAAKAAAAKPKQPSPLVTFVAKLRKMTAKKPAPQYSPADTKCTVEPVLSDYDSRQKGSLKELITVYFRLGKHRLSFLVVFTAVVGHYMCHGGVVSGMMLATGTLLLSLSANGCNQVIERNVDGLMNRTKMRPMVVGTLSVPHAVAVLATSAVAGSAILFYGCNPLTAILGMSNWALYVMVYTPMKRYHWLNTWVGAFVGLLPPLMGVAAATGTVGMFGVFLGGVLYLWQIPHFMSLSYLCREEYASAGFKMLPSLDPKASGFHSYTHSIALFAWCVTLLPYIGCTTPLLTVETAFLTSYLIMSSSAYRRNPTVQTARSLFRLSILFLTLMMLLLMFHRSKEPIPVSKFIPTLKHQLRPAFTAAKEVGTAVKVGLIKTWKLVQASSVQLFYAAFPSLAPQPKRPAWPPVWEVTHQLTITSTFSFLLLPFLLLPE